MREAGRLMLAALYAFACLLFLYAACVRAAWTIELDHLPISAGAASLVLGIFCYGAALLTAYPPFTQETDLDP